MAAHMHGRLVVLAAAVAFAYVVCPIRFGVVYGHSMDPTLRPGEVCVLDRSYYAHHPVRRGDIIVFRLGDEILTKRVYAAPGDAMTVLRYPAEGLYAIPSIRVDNLRAAARRVRDARLVSKRMASDQCFVLGDNADVSCDSRDFGPISISTIIGKMVKILD